MSAIYIHIPFCKQACHYCDFHFSTRREKQSEMVNAICGELVMRKGELGEDEIESVYFGGGTPSVLKMEELNQILDAVYLNYKVHKSAEITLEANPDDLTKKVIEDLADSRVNRLSIGVQSFFDEDLKLMNRAHDAAEAENCLSIAAAHFDNISIDLIYGIPGMCNESWLKNIEKALSFNIPHISAYALTVEPKTALKHFIDKGLVAEVDDGIARDQFILLIARLEEKDFVHYEISNFGKQGYFSKNNTGYWQGRKYIGIGPSAHSYDGTSRSWNVRNNPKYIRAIDKQLLPMEREILTKEDNYNEYVMTGLRTIWGVSLQKINEKYGPEFGTHLIYQANKYIKKGLLSREKDTLTVTKKGKFLVDGIAADLFLLNLKDRK